MNSMIKKFSFFALLILLVGAMGLTYQHLTTSEATIPPPPLNNLTSDGIYMDMASWEADHNPEGIASYIEVIVIAKIIHIEKAKWNTVDGKRPADWAFFNVHEVAIYTPFSFEVKKVIKGDITSGETHQFAVIGGTVGADVLDANNVDIYGDLQVGDEALLFLGKSRGNMAYIGAYTYGDALRIEGKQIVAGCKQSRISTECRNTFNLITYLSRVEQAK